MSVFQKNFIYKAGSWIDPWPYFAEPLLHIQSQVESIIVRKILFFFLILFLRATKRDEQYPVITWIQIQRDCWLDLSFYFSCIALQSFYLLLLFYHFVSKHLISLEKAMARHSSTLAWKILWTEEPGRLRFMSLVGCHLWGRTESDTTEAT